MKFCLVVMRTQSIRSVAAHGGGIMTMLLQNNSHYWYILTSLVAWNTYAKAQWN
jgi:hypothetical protein